MRLLLFGGTGQVGTEVRNLALPRGIEVVAPTRSTVDLNDPRAIAGAIAAEPWHAVVNAAGYTHVDKAEAEEALAFAINAKAAECIAAEAGHRRIPVIHISTDYVYDGSKGAPYREDDGTAPLNAYGRSKLAGEQAVSAANSRHIIVRTAWVYSPYGNNFVRTILRLAQERERLTIVADQRGCPTAAIDIANACLTLASRCASEPQRAPYGVYHFAGAGEASWYELAVAIVELAAKRLDRSSQTSSPQVLLAKVLPIRTSDYPTAAVRPADTRLDCSAIARAFGITLRPWHCALAETIERLLTVKDAP